MSLFSRSVHITAAAQTVFSPANLLPTGINSCKATLGLAVADLQDPAVQIEFGFQYAAPGASETDPSLWRRFVWAIHKGNPANDPAVEPWVFSDGAQLAALVGRQVRGYLIKTVTSAAFDVTLDLDLI